MNMKQVFLFFIIGVLLCSTQASRDSFAVQAEKCMKTAYLIIHTSLPSDIQKIYDKLNNDCLFKIRSNLQEADFSEFFPDSGAKLAKVILVYHNTAGISGQKEENLQYLAKTFGKFQGI